MRVASMWHDEPAEHDYPAAQDYLELTMAPADAAVVVANLRCAETITKRAKDIIRASRLPLLRRDNKHVEHNIDKAESGEKLNPILLVRGDPLVIADGYHRACAAYYVSEDTEVRCRVADRTPTKDVAAEAREAYAEGWAATGGPMTDRVKAGCIAAVEHATAHADDPEILEVTLNLGSLEGTWAMVYDRREKLYTQHDAAVLKAWRTWVADIDLPELVKQYRRRVGLVEATTDEQRQRKEREAAAIALALSALQGLATDTEDPKFHAVVAAVEAALRSGEAEGQAGAIAIAAQQIGRTSVAFDRAYTDALASLQQAERFAGQAQQTVTDILSGAAIGLGKAISGADELDSEDAASSGNDTLNDGRSASAYTDWSMGNAFQWGSLAVYAALNVRLINWISAGDTKVCKTCIGYEENSPYSAFDIPGIPHPTCRCSTSPSEALSSLGRFAQYVLGD